MGTIVAALSAAAALAAASSPGAAQPTPSPIAGDWTTGGGWATIRIGPCANDSRRLCGVIIRLRRPNGPDGRPLLDTANRDPRLRTRPVVGLPFLTGFRGGPTRWTGGRIYDPDSGNTYDSNLRLRPDGRLEVNGCVLVVCRAQVWVRAAP